MPPIKVWGGLCNFTGLIEYSPLVLGIIKDAKEKFGSRAWSSMVVKRLEDKYNTSFRTTGYPEELVDKEKKLTGYEI